MVARLLFRNRIKSSSLLNYLCLSKTLMVIISAVLLSSFCVERLFWYCWYGLITLVFICYIAQHNSGYVYTCICVYTYISPSNATDPSQWTELVTMHINTAYCISEIRSGIPFSLTGKHVYCKSFDNLSFAQWGHKDGMPLSLLYLITLPCNLELQTLC